MTHLIHADAERCQTPPIIPEDTTGTAIHGASDIVDRTTTFTDMIGCVVTAAAAAAASSDAAVAVAGAAAAAAATAAAQQQIHRDVHWRSHPF